jgi:DNA-binding response OmpR family regulator
VPEASKRILLIDLDESRRVTSVHLLTHAGCDVDVRNDHVDAERRADEVDFDLVIVALHEDFEDAAACSERLRRSDPTLPVLLLTDRRLCSSGDAESGY